MSLEEFKAHKCDELMTQLLTSLSAKIDRLEASVQFLRTDVELLKSYNNRHEDDNSHSDRLHRELTGAIQELKSQHQSIDSRLKRLEEEQHEKRDINLEKTKGIYSGVTQVGFTAFTSLVLAGLTFSVWQVNQNINSIAPPAQSSP